MSWAVDATTRLPHRFPNPTDSLYDARARFYDPSTAGGHRFLSQDPIGGGYVYAGGSPTNFVDPTGRMYARGRAGGSPTSPKYCPNWAGVAAGVGVIVLFVGIGVGVAILAPELLLDPEYWIFVVGGVAFGGIAAAAAANQPCS